MNRNHTGRRWTFRVGMIAALCVPALALSLVLALGNATARAQPARPDAAAVVAQRDEAIAYAIGLQAYLYGYPALDYMRVMREQTTAGADPHGVYAPINHIYFQDGLAEPGGFFAGRAPNTSTIYFSAWLDLSSGPVTIDAPDTHDRYYVLTYADFYADVQHTGRRTTGTAAQRILVVGPGWNGKPPAGVHLIRLRTDLGYLLGRVLVDGPQDLSAARSVMRRFRLSGPTPTPAARQPPAPETLTSPDVFRSLNIFLKNNPRLPGEDALMAQFDRIGVGPGATFDARRLSTGTRRGLERAVADGHAILANAPLAAPVVEGWTPMVTTYGNFGFDYLERAIIEYNGFLGNLPQEAVYPSAQTDASGDPLNGGKRYRIVFPANGLPPNDAFWAINAYDLRTMDLFPNRARRYAVSDRMPDLRRRADGAVEIRTQQEEPAEQDVNWLPVGAGRFFLSCRIYQPRAPVLDGRYTLPPIEALP
ncbi:MAG: DUF1214 domain-containing protein [Candidatus Binatia bacterium]